MEASVQEWKTSRGAGPYLEVERDEVLSKAAVRRRVGLCRVVGNVREHSRRKSGQVHPKNVRRGRWDACTAERGVKSDLIQDEEDEVKAREEGGGEVHVVHDGQLRIVARVDRVRRGQDRCTGVEGADDTGLCDRDGLHKDEAERGRGRHSRIRGQARGDFRLAG